MLHEILVSLAGYPSQIFATVKSNGGGSNGIHDYVSEPEKAMLEVLQHISDLHIQIRDTAAKLAAEHKSVVCRAICAAVNEVHLAAFRKKVLDVEASVLSQSAGYVGGYNIVPLSTIVSDFQPWSRRLEWLRVVTRFAEGRNEKVEPASQCSGKSILDWLQSETHTGYIDIEDLATQLLIAGQKVWLRLAASWLLYGRLPTFGASDFFVQRNAKSSSLMNQFEVDHSLVPGFVSPIAANSILEAGNALVHVQSHATGGREGRRGPETQSTKLMSKHIQALESVQYPINAHVFQEILAEIDGSISESALSQLLPFEDISRLLQMVHRFMLLGDGEFAITLIEHATARIGERQRSQTAAKPVRKAGRLDDLIIKESELSTLLTKSWDELALIQSDLTLDEEVFDLARKVLVLRNLENEAVIPISTLLPSTTILDIQWPTDSSLGLFMSPSHVRTYSSINAYLLSVRRTELQLANLWKLTSQRRCHPTPLGPPRSASRQGQQALLTRRKREASRARFMRQHWATSSKALFILSELDGYLHGEVIQSSWERFGRWLSEKQSRPTPSSAEGSRPGTATSAKASHLSASTSTLVQRSDPRALAQGHHVFLNALHASLLLEDRTFMSSLKELLMLVDHYVALFLRLQLVWEGLDLQEGDGVVDAFSSYAQDEQDLRSEMVRSRALLEEQIVGVVQRLKDIEKDRLVDAMIGGVGGLDLERQAFVAWSPRTMDRLIMKLDFLSGMRDQADEDDGIMNDD